MCNDMQETGRHVPERKVSLALSMGSAALYGTVAIAMGFANKAALQIFGLANTLLLLQMCTVLIVVGALRVSKKDKLRSMEYAGLMTLAGRLIHSFNPLGVAALEILPTHFCLLVRLSFRALSMLMSGSFRLSGQGSCPGECLPQHLRLAHRMQYAVVVQVSGRLQFLAVHKQQAWPLTPCQCCV